MNEDQKLKDLKELSIFYRGTILSKCITLEKDIEFYIISYFIDDDFGKHIDMQETLIDRLTFDGKISVFEELLKRNISPVDNFNKLYKKLFTALRCIRDVRNKFAHYPTNLDSMSFKKVPKEFSLVKYKNGAVSKVFSKGDFESFNQRIEKCLEVISKLNP